MNNIINIVMIPVAVFCLLIPFFLAVIKNALVHMFEDKDEYLSKYLSKKDLSKYSEKMTRTHWGVLLLFSTIMAVVVGPFGIPFLFNVGGPFFCGEGYQNVAADVSARWFDILFGLFDLTLTHTRIYCTGEMGEYYPPPLVYYGILTGIFWLLFTVLFVVLVYIDRALRHVRQVNTNLRYAAGILLTAGFWTFFVIVPDVFRPVASPISGYVATSRFGPLPHAVANDNIKMVRLLLKKGADPDMKILRGYSLLDAAAGHNNARQSNIEIFRLLLETGADPNMKTYNGNTFLTDAVYQGDIKITRLLLKNGADPNTGDRTGLIPLLIAIKEREIGVIKVLVKSGADVNLSDKTGQTPLMAAAVLSINKDIVELLVKNGADLKARDKDGKSVMEWARNSDMLHLLLRLGVGEGESPEKIKLREKGMEISLGDLVNSIRRNDLESVKLLIEAGVDLSQTGSDRRIRGLAGYNTPLIEAVERGTPGIVEILLKKGADVNAHSDYGYIPLVQAIGSSNPLIVEILLNNGANVNAIDAHGNNALIKAAKVGHGEVVKLLLDNGADINYRDNEDNTALTYAIKKDHGVVVKLLLERGAESD